jgi:hypothetical protein
MAFDNKFADSSNSRNCSHTLCSLLMKVSPGSTSACTINAVSPINIMSNYCRCLDDKAVTVTPVYDADGRDDCGQQSKTFVVPEPIDHRHSTRAIDHVFPSSLLLPLDRKNPTDWVIQPRYQAITCSNICSCPLCENHFIR